MTLQSDLRASDKTYTEKTGLPPVVAMTDAKTMILPKAAGGVPGRGEIPMESRKQLDRVITSVRFGCRGQIKHFGSGAVPALGPNYIPENKSLSPG